MLVTRRAARLEESTRRIADGAFAARGALRGGDAAGALRKLDELGTRFPGGVLAQEREALAIEALYTTGQRAAASARAEAFLRAYPNSPHATRLRSFAP